MQLEAVEADVLNVSLNWSISLKSLSSSTRSSRKSGLTMLDRLSHTSAGAHFVCRPGVLQSRRLPINGQ